MNELQLVFKLCTDFLNIPINACGFSFTLLNVVGYGVCISLFVVIWKIWK